MLILLSFGNRDTILIVFWLIVCRATWQPWQIDTSRQLMGLMKKVELFFDGCMRASKSGTLHCRRMSDCRRMSVCSACIYEPCAVLLSVAFVASYVLHVPAWICSMHFLSGLAYDPVSSRAKSKNDSLQEREKEDKRKKNLM